LVPVVNAIDTEGTTDDVTVIVIPVLVAVNGLAQGELDDIIQVTTWPVVKPVVVYVVLFVPALAPFTCH
jgi:hypothetical protein